MSQLWKILFVGQSLEIGEPFKFADRESKPIGQGPDGLDDRNIPCRDRSKGLHSLRFDHPSVH